MVVYAYNPSTLGGRGRQISEASLVYRVSSRTARVIQRNHVLKKPNPKDQKEKKGRKDRRTGLLYCSGHLSREWYCPQWFGSSFVN